MPRPQAVRSAPPSLSRKHVEAPLDGEVEAGELDLLAGRVIRWMREDAPRDRLSVAGLMGPRGSGKTSLMRRVLKLAGSASGGRGGDFHLPSGPEREAPIFDPGLSRGPGELLFDLLDFLDRYSGESGREEALQSAQRHAAEMTEPARFLDLVKELAPSVDALERDLAKRRCTLAKSDQMLRVALDSWGKQVRQGNRLLVLPIDDADLDPQLGHATLEYLWRYLGHLPIVVVLCADYATLVVAVECGLKDLGHVSSDLAVAYVDKHVPYRWALRPWAEDLRYDFMWEAQPKGVGAGTQATVESALAQIWASERIPLARVLDAMKADVRLSRLNMVDAESTNWTGFTEDESLRSFLGPIMPAWPRALKRLHNRLVDLIDDPDLIATWARRLIVDKESATAVLSLVLAVDVCWPAARLWTWIESGDNGLFAHLEAMRRQTLGQKVNVIAPLDEFLAEISNARGLREAARAGMVWLAWLLYGLRGTGQIVLRLIAVSLDADAAVLAIQNLGVNPAQVSHLDLRRDGETARPSLSSVAERLSALEPRLRELETLRAGRIQLVAKAPLSALTWLGWRLRAVPVAEAFNDGPDGLRPFRLPSRRIEPRNRSGLGFFSALDTEFPPPSAGATRPQTTGKILLVIDLLRRVSESDLQKFPDDMCPIRVRRLQARQMDRPLESQDLPDILQDVVDQVAWLRAQDGVQEFHLAVVGPDVVAFALGRQLHAMGRFHLYDWDRNSQRYVFVCRFPEDGQEAQEPVESPTFFVERAAE